MLYLQVSFSYDGFLGQTILSLKEKANLYSMSIAAHGRYRRPEKKITKKSTWVAGIKGPILKSTKQIIKSVKKTCGFQEKRTRSPTEKGAKNYFYLVKKEPKIQL